ncbi:YccS family putative transporter [Telmatospirillum siberiense]|uniref:TIGR01666 family membrane protein n=1 Tax=Telmatospirillum siberiense TaxID=382514 RepID=A0A2N3PR58_9PROT|nr:YccS family putative transporter [Telmatospirillum siberiense]PKU22889.1 TIGR01666 family membrane protein [Telmatospirillum siberiense]
MTPPSFFRSLQRLWALEKFSYSLRVFIALSGAMGACWLLDRISLIIPFFLGIIAAALAETDDSWRGRLKATLLTLVLFAVSSFIVELLTPYPALFTCGIVLSTFTFSMFGALGERYATIAQAALILAVYTMLGLEQAAAPQDLWHEPMLLTIGAAWYGLLSVLWHALFANQPVQQGLAGLFEQLGGYMEAKSTLFEPSRQLDVGAERVALARQNGKVVIALNQVKELIRSRLRDGHAAPGLDRSLALFFLAQDIHERASSSHYPYDEFAAAFFHSDVMFRCQRLLRRQGEACRALGRAIRFGEPFSDGDSRQALADLQDSFSYLGARDEPAQRALLRSLGDLVGNLTALEQALAGAKDPGSLAVGRDNSLFDGSPHSVRDAWERIRRQITPSSPVFRHALRLTLALAAGYGVKYLIHPTLGYWILLTTLFVCLPNYASTRQRLWERIFGTVLGLVAGWASITLFPEPEIQRLIAVAAGVAFFLYRSNRYILATGAITLMVVCCFNQVVDGYAIIWPRLTDTLLGSLISGLAVFFILPDWQGRRLHKEVAATLRANAGYLREIIRQYSSGKSDDLAYRLARRNAHAADAALSGTLSNMLQEPGRFSKDAESCLRNLVMSHTLLGYLSALGAHRDNQSIHLEDERVVGRAAEHIARILDDIAGDLDARRPVAPVADGDPRVVEDLESMGAAEPNDDRSRLLRTQLSLIGRQLAPIRALAAQFQQNVSEQR